MVPEIQSVTGWNFLSFWDIFCPITPLTTQKIKILKYIIWRYHLKISFYTCIPRIAIIWCILPEIWSETDTFFVIGHFLPYCTPNDLENENFERTNIAPEDIRCMHTKNHMHTHAYHFTHGYQKSQSQHIVYASWDMEWDRQIFCRFGPFFCPFTPLATQKIKMLKKFKKHLKILSFYTSVVPKIMMIQCTVPEIWCVMDVIVIFHFGLFFALLSH